MTMRKEFELTNKQMKELLAACKPVPYMVFGGCEPSTPQANANAAWCKLGAEMGFHWDSVKPVPGKSSRFFTAEVKEEEKHGEQSRDLAAMALLVLQRAYNDATDLAREIDIQFDANGQPVARGRRIVEKGEK